MEKTLLNGLDFIKSLCKEGHDETMVSTLVNLIVENIPLREIFDLSINSSSSKDLTTHALKVCVNLSAMGTDQDTIKIYRSIEGYYEMVIATIVIPWVQICDNEEVFQLRDCSLVQYALLSLSNFTSSPEVADTIV